MFVKILQLLTVLAYSMIVSQSFMYLLALKSVQMHLDVNAYTQFRKLVDTAMRYSFKYVIYAALASNLVLVIASSKESSQLVVITGSLAMVALVVDTLITVKGNLPINDIINTWTPAQYPANWADYRQRWLEIFLYRQIVNISGFLILLVGVIFGSK